MGNNSLRNRDQIGPQVGRVLGRRRIARHVRLSIEDGTFRFVDNAASIDREAALGGFYGSLGGGGSAQTLLVITV